MLDEPLSRPHRLRYSVRGPEWAFAIPQGDLNALDEVMRRCALFWNGTGSLIVPVRSDGRINREIDGFLIARSVEHCFFHESLSDRAREAVAERFPRSSQLWDHFDDDEVHPLLFAPIPNEGAAKPPLLVPEFTSAPLRRANLACWGYMHPEDEDAWHERFEIRRITNRGEAAAALVAGQTEIDSTSPSASLHGIWALSRKMLRGIGHT
jgi:hypothetical protein